MASGFMLYPSGTVLGSGAQTVARGATPSLTVPRSVVAQVTPTLPASGVKANVAQEMELVPRMVEASALADGGKVSYDFPGPVVDIVDLSATTLVYGKASIDVPRLYEIDSTALTRVRTTERFLQALPEGEYVVENTSGGALTFNLLFWYYRPIRN